ncbi:hypothetical protein FOG50_02074 [Hanseniaspora uvarum]|nr:hypothetical protein FOG50_02074 [Hanseniaspora uvarum]GMM39768.1 TATA-binding protein-associated factor [Hanseniaspora uvarum]
MVESTKRTVRVKTKQSKIEEEPPVEGFPVHRWSIEVVLLDAEGNEMPGNIFDRVVYHLHPTFVNPNRTIKKAPFRIEEKGWGGFEMSISLFLAEKSGERKVKHDLHFGLPEYDIEHTINIPLTKPKLNLLLQESGPIPASAPTVLDTANAQAVLDNDADLTNAGLDNINNDNVTQNNNIHNTAVTPAKRGRGASMNNVEETVPKNKKQRVTLQVAMKGSIDLEKLALGLTKLNEEQVIAIVQMITDNATPEMNVKNNAEDGEFIFDLFSMPEGLLKSMNEFIQQHTLSIE